MAVPPFLLLPVCSRAGYQAGRLVLGQTGRLAPISFLARAGLACLAWQRFVIKQIRKASPVTAFLWRAAGLNRGR
jgi:hypothetical protein